MPYEEQLISGRTAIRPGHLIRLRRLGASVCIMLVICLTGCQPRVAKTPPLPPPLPAPAASPQPVRSTFYVTINGLSLRTCPGLDCPKTSSLRLNAEVEKMGEIQNWAQVRVKKDGTVGYVSSRYLSPQPVKVAKAPKKKFRKAKSKHPKVEQPPVTAEEKKESAPHQQEPAPALPKIM